MTDQPQPQNQPQHPSQRYDRKAPSNQPASPRHCAMLPHAAPQDEENRLILFAFRRMAQHGLRDAVAAERLLAHFAGHFRAPLVLLRAFVLELAQTGARNIVIGHCCMPRMTADEAAILGVIADPHSAAEELASLMGGANPSHALQIAYCLADKLADARV